MTLDAIQSDGAPLRSHYESIERQTGELQSALWPVDCPDEVKYLWRYFGSMNMRRGNNGFGPNPLTHADIAAWEKRHGIALVEFEHDAIDALESLYLRIARKPK